MYTYNRPEERAAKLSRRWMGLQTWILETAQSMYTYNRPEERETKL